VFSPCPAFTPTTNGFQEHAMNFYRSQATDYSDLLQEAAARTGFSASEMQELLESELNVDHLLSYITAVVSNRMN
jgi:hypothetical protein